MLAKADSDYYVILGGLDYSQEPQQGNGVRINHIGV